MMLDEEMSLPESHLKQSDPHIDAPIVPLLTTKTDPQTPKKIDSFIFALYQLNRNVTIQFLLCETLRSMALPPEFRPSCGLPCLIMNFIQFAQKPFQESAGKVLTFVILDHLAQCNSYKDTIMRRIIGNTLTDMTIFVAGIWLTQALIDMFTSEHVSPPIIMAYDFCMNVITNFRVSLTIHNNPPFILDMDIGINPWWIHYDTLETVELLTKALLMVQIFIRQTIRRITGWKLEWVLFLVFCWSCEIRTRN